jgi:transposase
MSPTTTVAHAVDACPDCGTHLVGGWVQRTRQVLELPIQPVEVIEHQYLARECPLCGKRHVPRVALDGLVLGRRHRLGLRLVSRIVTLREAGRLPFATIQWYLATVHGLHLSVGELVGVVQSVAKRASPAVEQIRAAIQDSAVVHADETGWREKGVNGYVWTFSTPTARYFTRGKRSKEVVDTALGPAFAGVLVSDFYAAYHHYPGVHQRCWAHLLRDIHELKDVYPTDAGLADWAAVVLALYREGADFVGPDEAARLAKQRELEERLSAACRPFAADPLAVQRKLCRRIARHLKELFVFVGDPRVPATNNAAERSLRPLVTSRKISGGTQSETGTTSKTTLASLFGTWRAQGRNPLDECLHLLQSPHQ